MLPGPNTQRNKTTVLLAACRYSMRFIPLVIKGVLIPNDGYWKRFYTYIFYSKNPPLFLEQLSIDNNKTVYEWIKLKGNIFFKICG